MAQEKLEYKPIKQKYEEEVVPALMSEFNIKNVMAVPTLKKIVINIGAGKAKEDKSLMDELVDTVATISGQKPVVTRSRMSVSNFKVREGMDVGIKVTLRRDRMWDFLDRLINISLPRTKDFRGVSSKSFDGKGNYSLGIDDQTVFPEIDTSKNIRLHGLQISIITSATDNESGKSMLKKLGMPFRK